MPLDGQRRRFAGPRQDVRRRLLGFPERRVRAAGVPDPRAEGSQGSADLGRPPVGQPLFDLQALEQYLPREDIKLSFADGILFGRMEKLIDRQVPAAALFSGPYYFAEQLGFRKIIDTTFMIASMITGDPDPEDVRKYFRALRRAQRDIDLRPSFTPTTTPRNSHAASSAKSTRGAGGRASASCSSLIRVKCSKSLSSGSRSTRSSSATKWGPGGTKRPAFHRAD